MMRRQRNEFVLLAQTPICHSAGNTGNHSYLMTRKVRTPSGDFEQLPILTGDTLRHKLREAASLALLDAAGIAGGLTEAALRLLFNGGMVTGLDGGAVKLDAYRELCELVPSLGLFGGCAQNRIVPGRLFVEDAVLICRESAHLVSDWQRKTAEREAPLDTFTRHIDEEQRVRMDASLNPTMRRLTSTDAQVETNRRLEASEKASASKDAVEKHGEKSMMMPRTAETICAGSFFAWSLEAIVDTDLDEDVLNVAICAFLSNAVVGGKAGTGHGRISVVAGNKIAMGTPSRDFENFDTSALASRVGQVFRAHVDAHIATDKDGKKVFRKDRIREFLGACSA